jgi:PAS domain S-box-containing protein
VADLPTGGQGDDEAVPETQLPGAAVGYRQLIESIPAITHLSRLDPSASTIYISPQVEAVTGYGPSQWLGDRDTWRKLLHPEDRARMLAANDTHVRTGEPITEEYRLVTRDGRVVWIHEESRVLRDEAGRPVGSQGILLDITARKSAEEELRRRVEAQRGLLDQLTSAQEAERARMARVVHDDAIQVLTAIGVRTELLAAEEHDSTSSAGLHKSADAVHDAIERLRSLVMELEPAVLERDGLVRAILLYLRQTEDQDGPSWGVENLLGDEPPSSIRTIAYRIAQEGISNVRKHSRARRAGIRFEPSEDGLLVTIHDDGIGFDPSSLDAIPLGHLGLRAMRERAEVAGGLCEVDSLPGRGTTVRFWLPM